MTQGNMTEPTHTILLVDDEPANLRMMQRLLRGRYRLLTALSGQAALEILGSEKVSLLLTDQRMPDMTGLELMCASRDIDADLAKIVVTGNTDQEPFVNTWPETDTLRVIHKPWDPETVLQCVEEALTRRETLLLQNKLSGIIRTSPALDHPHQV